MLEKEKIWGTLQGQTEGQQELHNRFTSEQELKSEYPSAHPADFASETVAAGDLDTEVALRTRLSGKLNTRNRERIEADNKEKSERLMAEDREIIASVKEQFEQLKADHESRFQELLSAANIPENQEKVTDAISKVEKLRGAMFGKEGKRKQANDIVKDIQTWFNEKWGINVDILEQEARNFSDQNSDRYRSYRNVEAPTLTKIFTAARYHELPEAKGIIEQEKEALFKEIEEYSYVFMNKHSREVLSQLRDLLKLSDLKEERD